MHRSCDASSTLILQSYLLRSYAAPPTPPFLLPEPIAFASMAHPPSLRVLRFLLLLHLLSLASSSSSSSSPSFSAPTPDLLPYPRSLHPAGALAPLYVVRATNLSRADVVTLQTLAGVLARTSPSIYVVNSEPDPDAPGYDGKEATVFWLRQLESRIPAASLPIDRTTFVDGDIQVNEEAGCRGGRAGWQGRCLAGTTCSTGQ